MMASSVYARMNLIFCVLFVLLTPPQMLARSRSIIIRDIEHKRVLVLTDLRCNNATRAGLGTSRWGWVRGLCHRSCRPGASWGRRVQDCDKGTVSPTTPTLTDAYTPCINATCRLPSVLHSLTVCILNNRLLCWNWSTWGRTQTNPSPLHISQQAFKVLCLKVKTLEFKSRSNKFSISAAASLHSCDFSCKESNCKS